MVQQGIVALVRGASKRWLGSSSVQRRTLLSSMYSLSRAFSSKLFVGGLSYNTNEEMLRKAFAEHGDVVDVRIITDRETGRSRGFGFITFSSESDAEAAKAKMSNHLLDGRFIRVDLASNRPPQSQASPRPPSTSPSGFSFGTPGTRPPSVEDWGPFPSSSWASNSSINTSSQGAPDSFNGGSSPSSSSSSVTSTGSSRVFEPLSSSDNNVSSFQSSSSAAEVQSSSFNGGTSTSVASVSTEQSTVSYGGVVSSSVITTQSTQGSIANDSTPGNASSLQMEAGQASTQTGSSMQGSNMNVVSPSGPRPVMGSGVSGAATGTTSNESSTKYEFPGFNNKPRDEMEEWKRRLVLPSKNLGPKRVEAWQSKLTEAAIPPPKGPVYDFGLGAIPDAPPPLDAGANPQGGFDPNVCWDDLPPEAEPVRLPYSIFTARTLPPLDLPYETPEADNWSVIGKPPRRIEDSPYSPFSPDLKDDPEFWWDPYDFDPEAKLLKEAFTEEPVEEPKTAETQPSNGYGAEEPNAAETKPSNNSAAEEARALKEPEAEETTTVKAAASS